MPKAAKPRTDSSGSLLGIPGADAVDADRGAGNPLPTGRYSVELALMGPVPGQQRADQIAFRDQAVDRHGAIRERSPPGAD